MFALIDCNNFYASCEKLFRPDLKHSPVVVLSNNDGCIVARSKEAKALGFKMGEPYFQAKEKIERHGVEVFSSNYELYAEVSKRVMETLESMLPAIEIYSIDEAFADLSGIASLVDLTELGQRIRARVQQYTGISVGVGIAPTKTLAKLANHAAKTYRKTGGVVVLNDPVRQQKLMQLTEVGEVWGVGRRLSKQLNEMGIETVWDFVQFDTGTIRKKFTVVLERTQRELKGQPCFALEEAPVLKQQIVCSRSFGLRVTELNDLIEAVNHYTSRACTKLRQADAIAQRLTVFCRTSPFTDKEPFYSNQASFSLTYPSDNTKAFLPIATQLISQIYKPNFRYAKAGIMLSDIVASGSYQRDLFVPETDTPKDEALMNLLDQLNKNHKGKLFFASEGINRTWAMKRGKQSPRYLTRWQDIPKVS